MDNHSRGCHMEAHVMHLSIAEIENAIIQHLVAASQTVLEPKLTPEDRRERIRIAIMKSRIDNKPLPADPTLTFGQAFELAYHRPCDMRCQELDIFGRLEPRR